MRHFWHLTKFHFLNLPWFVWLIGIFLVAVLGTIFAHVGGSTTLSTTEDNLVGLIYFFILATQLSWGAASKPPLSPAQTWTSGMHDFLRTRAVDRHTLFWSKLLVFGVICSMAWAVSSGPKLLRNQPVRVLLNSGAEDTQFRDALLHTPALGARILSTKKHDALCMVELDRGSQVIAGLAAAKTVLLATFILFLSVALRLSFLWWMGGFFGIAMGFWLLALLQPPWLGHNRVVDVLFEYRTQLLFYAHHSIAIWAVTGALVVIGICAAKRRYLRP